LNTKGKERISSIQSPTGENRVEYPSQEAEAEVGRSSVILVERQDICLGTILKTKQQIQGELMLQKLKKG
jgi:hypothetical protein